MKVTILGTSSAMPTFRRCLSGTILERENESFLFDCGEGTQFQVMHAKLRRGTLKAIFITHLHGDHFFGLPGFLSTLALNKREKPLTLWGPRGLKEFMHTVLHCPRPHKMPFLRIREIGHDESSVLVDHPAYQITTTPLRHRIDAHGYRLEEKPRSGTFDSDKADELGIPFGRERGILKGGDPITLDDGRVIQPDEVVGPPIAGKVFAYCTDTVPCAGAVELARGADILMHEATYADAEVDLAKERGHSTIRQAATIAKEAGVKTLVATHFSTRYRRKDLERMHTEGKEVFENIIMAEDLMSIEI